MKPWLKVEIMPLVLVMVVQATLMLWGGTSPWMVVGVLLFFSVLPALAGVFYGYSMALARQAKQIHQQRGERTVLHTKGGV